MIWFACDSGLVARALAGALPYSVRTVDGPFAVYRGAPAGGGPNWTIVNAGRGSGAHYAAIHLAMRRGARQVIAVGEATAAPAYLRATGTRPGDIVPVDSALDLAALVAVQRLCPDAATALPVALPGDPGNRPGRFLPLAGHGTGARVGTTALPMTCAALADAVFERWGTGLFDGEASGAADAADELDAPVAMLKVVRGRVAPAWKVPRGGHADEARLREALLPLVEALARASD